MKRTLMRRAAFTAWPWLSVLLAVLIAVAVYRGAARWPADDAQVAPLDPGCDLRAGPCWTRFPTGGGVQLGIEPRSIPILQPLTLTVTTDGLQAGAVEVDFAGTDMDMGFNRVGLEATGENTYRGQALLPLCVRRRMHWEAKVILDTPQGTQIAPFRFETRR